MSDQLTTLLIEIPSDVAQHEVWNVAERLQQVEGVTSELQEPKDFLTPTLLFLHVTAPYLGQLVTVGEGIKALYDSAKILYDFLHRVEKEKISEQGKNKVVIIKKGKRIELYNLSSEEIVQVLREQ